MYRHNLRLASVVAVLQVPAYASPAAQAPARIVTDQLSESAVCRSGPGIFLITKPRT